MNISIQPKQKMFLKLKLLITYIGLCYLELKKKKVKRRLNKNIKLFY